MTARRTRGSGPQAARDADGERQHTSVFFKGSGPGSTAYCRKTYAAALEQTEQMYRAAALVGPATRPLQVFYSLRQAGRATESFFERHFAAAAQPAGSGWTTHTMAA